ncbi:MAG: hypothetical protein ACOH2T_18925 [Pseudomonas sp.]
MRIPVVGFDPSLRNWGVAVSQLDLTSGLLDTPSLSLVQTTNGKGKQVRQNSADLQVAEELATAALALARKAKVVFVECPVGSQSSRAMASYGICVGILGAIRAEGIPLIEVTPLEVKLVMSGLKTATKHQMIDAAVNAYPGANWPMHQGKVSASKAEHMADAIGAIHAGVRTPTFQNLMRLFAQV